MTNCKFVIGSVAKKQRSTKSISCAHWEMLHSVQHDKRNLWPSCLICVICVPLYTHINSHLSSTHFPEEPIYYHIGTFSHWHRVYVSLLSPSSLMHQKSTPWAPANSFMRQADWNPLAAKCMGTSRRTWKRWMNWRAPRV